LPKIKEVIKKLASACHKFDLSSAAITRLFPSLQSMGDMKFIDSKGCPGVLPKLGKDSSGRCGKGAIRKTLLFPLASLRPFPYTLTIQTYNPSQQEARMAKKIMTKAEIVSHFAKRFELPKNAAAAIIEEVAALAVSETKKAGSFTLPGIGKLVLAKRKARLGRNPATGATIKIPAKTVVKIRIAKAAKEAIVPGKK
jgi:DNA-binding protein HU-beta